MVKTYYGLPVYGNLEMMSQVTGSYAEEYMKITAEFFVDEL